MRTPHWLPGPSDRVGLPELPSRDLGVWGGPLCCHPHWQCPSGVALRGAVGTEEPLPQAARMPTCLLRWQPGRDHKALAPCPGLEGPHGASWRAELSCRVDAVHTVDDPALSSFPCLVSRKLSTFDCITQNGKNKQLESTSAHGGRTSPGTAVPLPQVCQGLGTPQPHSFASLLVWP